MANVIDISGLNFFLPVFSFLFVFIVTWLVLKMTKVVGENNGFLLFLSLIMAVIFMSFSSINLYVTTIIPWMVVLVFVIFAILLVTTFAGKSFKGTPLAIIIAIVLVLVFLVAAIQVFNPVFHSDLVLTEGNSGGVTMMDQLRDFFGSSKVAGSLLLILAAGVVSWVLFKTN